MNLMRRGRFRVAGNVTFGLLVVGVIAELGASVWLSHRHDSPSAPVQVAAAETTTVPADPANAAPAAPIATVTPPSTTIAGVPAPVIARGSVTYTLAAGTEVEVHATGPCWIQVRRQKGSPVIDDMTLATGTTKTYLAPVWMRFGNAVNVSVTVGSTQLKLPPSPGDLIITTGSGGSTGSTG